MESGAVEIKQLCPKKRPCLLRYALNVKLQGGREGGRERKNKIPQLLPISHRLFTVS